MVIVLLLVLLLLMFVNISNIITAIIISSFNIISILKQSQHYCYNDYHYYCQRTYGLIYYVKIQRCNQYEMHGPLHVWLMDINAVFILTGMRVAAYELRYRRYICVLKYKYIDFFLFLRWLLLITPTTLLLLLALLLLMI